MEKTLTKKKAEELMKIEGEIRGSCIQTDWQYILEKKGEKGIRKIEKRMRELGFPFEYRRIKATYFYPIGIDVLSMLVIKEVFDFNMEDFKEMGVSSAKLSLLIRIVMKYFLSFRAIIEQTPKMWREHFSIGNLKATEINEAEKYIVLRLEDFAVSPLYCSAFEGYFFKILEFAGKNSISSKETKCTFKGDDYHEFLLKWR